MRFVRRGYNPCTGEDIAIPERKVSGFKAWKTLKDAVAAEQGLVVAAYIFQALSRCFFTVLEFGNMTQWNRKIGTWRLTVMIMRNALPG